MPSEDYLDTGFNAADFDKGRTKLCPNCFQEMQPFSSILPNQWGCVNYKCKGSSVYCPKCHCSMERSLAAPYDYECCSYQCINTTRSKAEIILELLNEINKIGNNYKEKYMSQDNPATSRTTQPLPLTQREKLARSLLQEVHRDLVETSNINLARDLRNKIEEIFPPSKLELPKYHIVKEVEGFGNRLFIAQDESIRAEYVAALPEMTREVMFELWSGEKDHSMHQLSYKSHAFDEFIARLSKFLGGS